MKRTWLVLSLFIVSLQAVALLPVPAQTVAGEIPLREALVIGQVARGGRVALPNDPVAAQIAAGTWTAPKAGATLLNSTATWQPLTANKDGVFSSPALAGGYAWMKASSEKKQVLLLEARAHTMVYVNGEPRTGDPYEYGMTRLPVLLNKGENEFLFLCGRGRLQARLVPAKAPALINAADPTLPDFIAGETKPVWGAVVILNATERPLTNLTLTVSGKGMQPVQTALPPVPPLTCRKTPFLLGKTAAAPGTQAVQLQLSSAARKGVVYDTANLTLRVRRPNESQKRTFLSQIDGSLQYYALLPAQAPPRPGSLPALFLSLHGASVEAIGQAEAYAPKSWGHLVAPTNRRPFGFDWEDWGRLDALEVLNLAQKTLRADPQRTYLTGHSMGGHGTWHLGVTFPDRFAAIAPSAGWVSFFSYAGGRRFENPTPIEAILQRANAPSDTLTLATNLRQLGVYILHGDADDNVPVSQARTMKTTLEAFHKDWLYYEQPGAGHWWDSSDEPGAACVDWSPMFDFFARRLRPTNESVREIEFTTASPGVSAWRHWVGIEAQERALQPSAVQIRCDPGLRRFAGTTTNVARLCLDVRHLPSGNPILLELDGLKLPPQPYPDKTGRLWLQRDGKLWQAIPKPSPAQKNPSRSGLFKSAFRNRMLLVYGTQGNAEENAWAYARARYDAETFWYRGNGAVDILSDKEFQPYKERDRNVILYGNADTNAQWNALLSKSPVQARRGKITAGGKEFTGSDLGCLFVYPRPDSDTASVGVVTGSGLPGLRVTDRLPVFVSGVGFPDLLLLTPDALTQGSAGVKGAGFFGNDWGVASGDFAWNG